MAAKGSKEKKLCIGIDLGYHSAMVSFYKEDMTDAETVSTVKGQQLYAIPTALLRTARGKYYYGNEAIKRAGEKDAVFRKQLLQNAINAVRKAEEAEAAEETEEMTAESEENTDDLYDDFGILNREESSESEDDVALLVMFLDRLIRFRVTYPGGAGDAYALCITVPRITHEILLLMDEVCRRMEISKEDFRLCDYRESYADYILHQDPTLSTYGSVLFDYEGDHIRYFSLRFGRQRSVREVFADEESFDAGTFDKKDDQARDESFAENVRELLGRRLISSVYLIGEGFDGNWMAETFRAIGPTRRIFVGRNLYTKGACLGLYKSLYGDETEYQYICEYKITDPIGLHVLHNQKAHILPLTKEGTNWFDNYMTFRLLYNGEEALRFCYVSEPSEIIAEFLPEDFPNRDPKSLRLWVEVIPQDSDSVLIHMKDEGFGDLFESTEKEWEYRI